MKIILIVFPKTFFGGKWDILGGKMMHGYNFGSALSIFKKFSTV